MLDRQLVLTCCKFARKRGVWRTVTDQADISDGELLYIVNLTGQCLAPGLYAINLILWKI